MKGVFRSWRSWMELLLSRVMQGDTGGFGESRDIM